MPEEAKINLRQLQYFVRIAEVGNITRAAEQLNVAQPALGLQIRQLEQELHADLLLRHSRGVELTEAGKLLLERARRLLQDVEEIKREFRGLSGHEQEMLILGLTPSIMLQIGPDMLLDAKQTMPNVSLSLVEELSYGLAMSLERGELNYAFAYGTDEPRPGVERKAILIEELLFVRPAVDTPLPESLTLAEALTHDLVQAGERDMVQRLLKSAAEKYTLNLRIVYEAQSIPAMRTLVVRGAASSFMPYGTAVEEIRAGKIAVQRISDTPLTRTLYLLKPSHAPVSRHQDAIDSFLDTIVKRLLESLGPLAQRVGASAPNR
ncbi:LysR family transcriptional regulator [uncultured Bosea sp.]|uniref:LysR family transcriptional regulator n=1 Tax=uncultured Bosea sp. TaxID=211457 RepID=UPI0025E846C0|nr:LysR family transcriptional regulator [uncultured Bosea sp.]